VTGPWLRWQGGMKRTRKEYRLEVAGARQEAGSRLATSPSLNLVRTPVTVLCVGATDCCPPPRTEHVKESLRYSRRPRLAAREAACPSCTPVAQAWTYIAIGWQLASERVERAANSENRGRRLTLVARILQRLVSWLRGHQIRQVPWNRPGVYWILRGGAENPPVTRCRFAKLCKSSPAPTSSISEIAISETTRVARVRPLARLAAPPRPPSLIVEFRSVRALSSAGARTAMGLQTRDCSPSTSGNRGCTSCRTQGRAGNSACRPPPLGRRRDREAVAFCGPISEILASRRTSTNPVHV
jgi:hypothetical protein